ncbi:hypothetical protein [Streptomyces sp. NPDC096030]|uniref:hypothetical protein n=1 Tax=Streptomyces sp. NPDC096030 TaxID=3155423 RepID=UPI00332E6377
MDTTIKIDSGARDRLATLAKARGVTMRALIEEFAASSLTPQELQDRAERTRAFLASEFGHQLSDGETAQLRVKMRAAQAASREQLHASDSARDRAA